MLEHSERIYVKKVKGKGRGVFARTAIRRGEIVERVPILLVPIASMVGGMENPTLLRYFFVWDDDHVAVTLGYGSIYNHSYAPNARYRHDRASQTMVYRALRDIAPGEEITINYNYYPDDKGPVGFEVVEKAGLRALGSFKGHVAGTRKSALLRSAKVAGKSAPSTR